MDAVKFIEERNRMCKSFGPKCKGCPASNAYEDEICGCAVAPESTLDATDQIAIVAEWSAAHPRKTRQSVFLEQWPNAKIRKDGILDIFPCVVCTTTRKNNNCESVAFSCVNCRREFWMQEVE